MSSERATLRPVNLSRLAEVTHLCEGTDRSSAEIADALDVTHRRARETILEAQRIGTLAEVESESESTLYRATQLGLAFVQGIRKEAWEETSELLAANSPHYRHFLQSLKEVGPASLETLLSHLEAIDDPPYAFNETSVQVLGDWAERLGVSQRNAFTGEYYQVRRWEPPVDFARALLEVFDDLEQTAGVDLRQRYLSIPELREKTCQELALTRSGFNAGLLEVVRQNIGKVELSGAPIDTGAKEAKLGIKRMTSANAEGLVSTSQSTEQVMAGVNRYDKQYYYLAVYDRDLEFHQDNE